MLFHISFEIHLLRMLILIIHENQDELEQISDCLNNIPDDQFRVCRPRSVQERCHSIIFNDYVVGEEMYKIGVLYCTKTFPSSEDFTTLITRGDIAYDKIILFVKASNPEFLTDVVDIGNFLRLNSDFENSPTSIFKISNQLPFDEKLKKIREVILCA